MPSRELNSSNPATLSDDETERKWLWMMEYCKKNGLPPGQEWAWSKATSAWEERCQVERR